MDNRGTPAPSNSQIRQNRDALFPNRRVTQNVEDHERLVLLTAASRRTSKEAENVADDNNPAHEEAERHRKGKMAVSASDHKPKRKGIPAAHRIPAGIVIKERENEKFATEESASETDSDDDDEYHRLLNVAILESLNIQIGEAPESSVAERRRRGEAAAYDIPLGAEHERQLNVACRQTDMVAPLLEIPEEIEIDYPSESLTDTEDDTGA